MSLTYNKPLNIPITKIVKPTTTTTAKSTSLHTLLLLMLINLLVIVLGPTVSAQSGEIKLTATVAADQYDLDEYLNTQTILIDTLRHYIGALEQKINVLKRKTYQIKAINDVALTDVHKYVNNPLNALTILKRFTSDWHILQQHAHNVNSTTEIVQNLTNTRKSLKFPSESDFDEAASNLLRIQGIYQLEPELLAMGQVNGVKLGSAMSWSDCLEIGRISVKNGDFIIAKYWMEVALGKLPTEEKVMNATEQSHTAGGRNDVVETARLEIMEALVATEFTMGNIVGALDMVNEMLQKQPKSEYLRKTKLKFENELEKSAVNSGKKSKRLVKKKTQSDKSIEELLIEEICRETANTGGATRGSHHIFNSRAQHCRLVSRNLPELALQPFQVEFVSLDPYVVIYHNFLRAREISDLQQIIEEEYAIDGDVVTKSANFSVEEKLATMAKRLQLATGHTSADFSDWEVEGWTFEDDVRADPLVPMSTQTVANVLINLQTPKLGGAIVFPQLELGIALPPNALLYWTQLNEQLEYDYRSKQHICPVIAGIQLVAYTSISA
ncbi:prolyl 4-hydroxylase subunit alpha-2 [Anastrepha obliqua]|uniref:prolyl 4-hydroxylase subunit alpha-2 n=1 Tax=Anastrepha obliqua TaxID=95512 RepID=UPI002409D42E|nr:prolyl 4-hydroxylase subunit alpha-2 [Anastrepha obliqua]